MGLIQKIKDLLGLTAMQQQQQQMVKMQQQQQEAFLAALKSISTQQPAPAPAQTAQPIVPISAQQQPSGEIEELRKQLETAHRQIDGLQMLLTQSKETAVREYLAAAKEVVRKSSESGSVGRPSLPGTKINLKIEEHLYEKICFLRESVPGFKVTPFINAAISKSLVSFYDEHPELLQVLQHHVDEE